MASGCYVYAILAREIRLPPGLRGWGGAAVSTVPWRTLAAATSPLQSGALRPTDDVIAHLLMMRGDEPMFWRRANQHEAWEVESGL